MTKYNKWNPVPWWKIQDSRCEPDSYETEVQVKNKWFGYDWRTVKRWHWEAACVSTFPGVFDDCEDNYEVEEKLRKAGVIHKRNKTDTESCALVLKFSTEAAAYNFASRLQAYIKEHSDPRLYCSCGIRKLKDKEECTVCEMYKDRRRLELEKEVWV